MARLRFGAFAAPFHPIDEHPALALQRDLELAEWMDVLGFDEYWAGEHHSGGWEINASPELFIAAAAQRTRTIKLGTGVRTLPYHHPLMLADRIRQLDYLTRGRLMFGVGPGSLPSDAYMLGVPTSKVRDRMDEAIDPLIRLLRGETVSLKTEWFTPQDARLQLQSYHESGVEICAASQVSPTGARAVGMFGLGMLSVGASSTGGFNALAANWGIAEDTAREHGKTVSRSAWRLCGPVHIAETREQARKDVQWGLHRWLDYFTNIATLPLAVPKGRDPVDELVESGFAVIGTPDDCVAQMDRLNTQSGGFGCFLNLHHCWADWPQTKRSYELMARYVIPKVNRLNVSRQASEDWLRHNNAMFRQEQHAAVGARLSQYAAEKGVEKLRPEFLEHFTKSKG